MEYFRYIVNDIHTVVAATTDNDGLPMNCAIDIMDCDEKGLYFLTAKGKDFYNRLTKEKYIALTGIKGTNTISSATISVRGNVKEVSAEGPCGLMSAILRCRSCKATALRRPPSYLAKIILANLSLFS